MTTERVGDLTYKGEPLTVLGDKLQPGDKAPDFRLTADDLREVTLADSAGKVRLISVVPALGTRICDIQTQRFNAEAANLGENVVILTVSTDEPDAQAEWCGTHDADRVQVLSDYQDLNFGDAWGTHVKEMQREQRAIFVVDAADVITYVEYVPEISQHPDYEAAITAVQAAANQ
ncbi:MAG TPA: thiol peroxidase [Anaerolineae bacterium]|nr:thiol peroxidase [Anaerolineae bacterium]